MPLEKPETFPINVWPEEKLNEAEARRVKEQEIIKTRERYSVFMNIVSQAEFERFWTELFAYRISDALQRSLDRSVSHDERRIALEVYHSLTELKNAPASNIGAMREILAKEP